MSDILQNKNAKNEAANRPIKILPPQLSNQIAAGEVVERPASVVKELVENSLDAEATQIHIEIEHGGQKRILVRDDGKGISKDQLTLALRRHATSKISNIDDLEHITSMGFRGEALASISSVSRLTLTSKPASQTEAWEAQAEGQQMEVEVRPAAHPDGTSIEVVDLFFNTPARRKFLRTGKTEFQHIEQIVKRIALTRPDVQFVLIHNHKVCCRYVSVSELSKRIEQVCGKNMLVNCLPINYTYEDVTLSGWCSKLGMGSATRDFQYTFVNGRMMKDKLLSHALRQVYEETLGPQTFANYVLYLQVPPQHIDVNVHPAKHEVRFHHARQIHDLVFKAISNGLSDNGDNGYINDLVQSPSHNYMQPLSPAEKPQKQVSYSSPGNSGYRPTTASKTQINASSQFYASLAGGNALDKQTSNEASETTQNLVPGQVAPRLNNCLYSEPYLVFGALGKLSVMDVTELLTKLVELRLIRSTLSQPLLIPVSIENSDAINQAQLDGFKLAHIIISASHRKLILKQVPSELRQLPWASIFAGINLPGIIDKSVSNSVVAQNIAGAWLNTLEISESMLEGWMNEIGQVVLADLIKTHAKSLHLATWLKDE